MKSKYAINIYSQIRKLPRVLWSYLGDKLLIKKIIDNNTYLLANMALKRETFVTIINRRK